VAASTSANKRILGKKSTNQQEVGPANSPVDQPPIGSLAKEGPAEDIFSAEDTTYIYGRGKETPSCPGCMSQRVWRDGVRSTSHGDVQRWLCRGCGYRFSEPKVQVDVMGKVDVLHSGPKLLENRVVSGKLASKEPFNSLPLSFSENVMANHKLTTVGKDLNTFAYNSCNRRVCVLESEAKNLAQGESRIQEKAAGATKPDIETIKGLVAQYAYWLEKEGYTKNSEYPALIRLLVKNGADLLDPESVKAIIAKQPWKNGTKMLAVYAYDVMAQMLKIQWTKPRYIQEEALPFIPEERELDALIAACKSRRMATYLQTLKETFADPSEALRLRWIDVDFSGNTVTINNPVKGHRPRQLKVSGKLLAMLNTLPKISERIFPTTYKSILATFLKLRQRTAQTLQNPRLLSISLTTFRHWGATMTYHYTKNILLVQNLLGHKHIKNTMKYTQLVHFKDDEFDVATATTLEEAKELLAVGFDYVTEMKSVKLFRRPKRFGY